MKKIILILIMWVAVALAASPAFADAEEDEALRRAQEQMNAEVLSQPFLAERPEEVDAYIKKAMEKNLKPQEYTGTHWKSGYTCRDLLRYSWREYRNCKYYYRYHGRYYW
jgi:Ni/Co efflux regulator RcnB